MDKGVEDNSQRRTLPGFLGMSIKKLPSFHFFPECHIGPWIDPIPTWIYLIWMNIIANVNKAKFGYQKKF